MVVPHAPLQGSAQPVGIGLQPSGRPSQQLIGVGLAVDEAPEHRAPTHPHNGLTAPKLRPTSCTHAAHTLPRFICRGAPRHGELECRHRPCLDDSRTSAALLHQSALSSSKLTMPADPYTFGVGSRRLATPFWLLGIIG